MKDHIVQFLRDEEGATAIEYGLIAGVIAVGILASLGTVRDALIRLFNSVVAALPAAPASGGGSGG